MLTLKRGYDLPESKRESGSIPVVSSSGITGYHNVAKAQASGVVTGRYGTLSEIYFIEEDFWPHNTALYVQDFKGNNQRFIADFLKYILFNTASDKAAVPGVNRNDLHAREIFFPSQIETQIRIASVLSAYDDLIENNRRRIQLLERSLHLLYKEWFVYLRFPSHEHSKIVDGIPEGWERKPLGSFITLNYGKSLQSDKRVSGNYPVYGSSGIIGTHIEPLVKGHGIIVGRKGNVGKVFWADSDYFPIDTVYFISPESSNFFLFYALLNTQFTSTDVAVPGLNRNFAHSVHILIPDKKLLEIFEDLAKLIRKQISIINKQNESLGKARDLLLPKLMSGAISV